MQKWTVEISVDDSWIADGYILKAEEVKDLILSELYGAFDDEVKVTIIGSPDLAELNKLRKE